MYMGELSFRQREKQAQRLWNARGTEKSQQEPEEGDQEMGLVRSGGGLGSGVKTFTLNEMLSLSSA